MSISERASGFSPAEIPERERSISERFRIAGDEWVDADAAANLLEETKTSVLAQKKMAVIALNNMPDNKAEMTVKASDDWHQHLRTIVEARKEANHRKVYVDYLRMRERELDRAGWHQRTEHKMGRSAT